MQNDHNNYHNNNEEEKCSTEMVLRLCDFCCCFHCREIGWDGLRCLRQVRMATSHVCTHCSGLVQISINQSW